MHADYAAARGKTRWADKTPLYAMSLDFVTEVFPDAQIVHLIRDGRDVVVSHRKRFGYWSAVKCVVKWPRYIRAARAAGATLPADRYYELRYEQAVGEPEKAMRCLFEFLGEPWEDGVLDYDSKQHDVAGKYTAEAERRRAAVGDDRPDLRFPGRQLPPRTRPVPPRAGLGLLRSDPARAGLPVTRPGRLRAVATAAAVTLCSPPAAPPAATIRRRPPPPPRGGARHHRAGGGGRNPFGAHWDWSRYQQFEPYLRGLAGSATYEETPGARSNGPRGRPTGRGGQIASAAASWASHCT